MIRASKGRASRATTSRARRMGLASWTVQGFGQASDGSDEFYEATGAFLVAEKLARRPDRDGTIPPPTWRIVPQDADELAQCKALAAIAHYRDDATIADIHTVQPAGGVAQYGDEVAFVYESTGRAGTFEVVDSGEVDPLAYINAAGEPYLNAAGEQYLGSA